MTSLRFSLARGLLAGVLATVVITNTGCVGLTAQLLYWIHGGHKIDPEYEGLSGQRVAVVCVATDSSFGPNSLCSTLQRSIGLLLQNKGDDIEVIDADEIADWVDSNDWDQMDYREIGRGVNADMVLAVDLDNFSLHEGRTLLKGQADVTITVYDMNDGGKVAFREHVPDFAFPQDGARHATDMSEARFRSLFIQVLAQQVAKYFCAFRIEEEFARDALTLGT